MATLEKTQIPIETLESILKQLDDAGLDDIAEQVHLVLCERLSEEADKGNVKTYSQSDIEALMSKYTSA